MKEFKELLNHFEYLVKEEDRAVCLGNSCNVEKFREELLETKVKLTKMYEDAAGGEEPEPEPQADGILEYDKNGNLLFLRPSVSVLSSFPGVQWEEYEICFDKIGVLRTLSIAEFIRLHSDEQVKLYGKKAEDVQECFTRAARN